MKKTPRTFYILTFLLIVSCDADRQEVNREDNLQSYLEHVRELFKVGGAVAVGVVKDGQVVEKAVSGFSNYELQVKATSQTPFYIASMTKSFIGVLVKILESEKVIDIEAPIASFSTIDLGPEINTNDLTLEDLLTHTSGVMNNLVGLKTSFTGDFANEELYDILKEESYAGVKGDFNYTNLGYIITGLILEEVTGKSWKTLLVDKIFEPLAMSSTTSQVVDSLAAPHVFLEQSIFSQKFLKGDDTMHAAGGLITNVDDMTNWLISNLDSSILLTDTLLNQVHTDLVPVYENFLGINNYGYGLGWAQGDWNELSISWHSGSYPGYCSVHLLVPEKKFGVVILMNQSSGSVLELVISYIISKYLGEVPEEAKLRKKEEQLVQRMNRAINYRDSIFSLTNSQNLKVEYSNYEGVYVSENNVELVVKEYNDVLTISMGNLLFTAEYISDDRFLVKSEVESFYDIADFHMGSTDAEVQIIGMNFIKINN